MLEIEHSGLLHQLARGVCITYRRADIGVLRVDRADMVVLGQGAAAVVAEFQQHRIVAGQRQSAADAGVGVGLVPVHLGVAVGAQHQGIGRDRLADVPAAAGCNKSYMGVFPLYMTSLSEPTTRSLRRATRPLVSQLSRNGVTHRRFCDLLKAVYVDVAAAEYG